LSWLKPEVQKKIFNHVMHDSIPDRHYFVMVILSCTVATYGLLSNSTAVVIGAMLIAPLMNPILGGALAISTGNNALLKISARSLVMGTVTSVILAVVLTLILPASELTSEVLSRTSPTILDLIIALASGAAGTYAMCFKPHGATLPGVAIATALMPPLCTVGIGLAKQNFGVVTGAFLLFLANMIAINVAASITFRFSGFSSYSCESSEKDNCQPLRYRLAYSLILLAIISIPLAWIMYKTYSHANTTRLIKTTLTESINLLAPQSKLISIEFNESEKRYDISSVFQTTVALKPDNIRQFENLLEYKLGKAVALKADVILIQKANNKTSIDTFQQFLPKIKEKEIVNIVKSSTPEEIIETTVIEKLALLPGSNLDDFSFEYKNGLGTYYVHLIIASPTPVDPDFEKTIAGILEEKLNRRVIVKTSSVSKQTPSPQQ